MRSPMLFALALLGLAPAARAADSIRCNGNLVSVGASKMDLVGKCGEPSHLEAREEQRSTFTSDPQQQTTSEKRVTVTVERWTYDFGSGEFIRYVSLENGKIVGIAEGGYGSAAGKSRQSQVPVSQCNPLRDFSVGDTSDAVLSRCGEPASREFKQVELIDSAQEPSRLVHGTSSTVTIEVWSYNFGATSFTRVLHFREGRLVRVVTGGYGFGG